MSPSRQLELVRATAAGEAVLRWADAPDVLTPAEAAALLRISRTSCYESLRSGTLKSVAVRWGRRKYLIPKAALRRLIESDGTS
jgi:excisionase family DNA binding protein